MNNSFLLLILIFNDEFVFVMYFIFEKNYLKWFFWEGIDY